MFVPKFRNKHKCFVKDHKISQKVYMILNTKNSNKNIKIVSE